MSLMLSEGLVLPQQDQEVVPWVTSLLIRAQHGGFSAGHGCDACQQGHSQRIGLFEHIEMSPALAQLCLSGADRHALQACAVKAGWSTLRANGEALWQQGSVSRHELHRVLGYEEA